MFYQLRKISLCLDYIGISPIIKILTYIKDSFGRISWPNYLAMKQILGRMQSRMPNTVSVLATADYQSNWNPRMSFKAQVRFSQWLWALSHLQKTVNLVVFDSADIGALIKFNLQWILNLDPMLPTGHYLNSLNVGSVIVFPDCFLK